MDRCLARAGHILGASFVELKHGGLRVVFSGDLSGVRVIRLCLRRPSCGRPDHLVVELTYGDRRHDTSDPENQTRGRSSTVLSSGVVRPSSMFAVGRAQELMYYLHLLKVKRAISSISPFTSTVQWPWMRHAFSTTIFPSTVCCVTNAYVVCRTAVVVNLGGRVGASQYGRRSNDHPGRERHGYRRAGGSPHQGVGAGSEEHHSVRGFSGGGNTRGRDAQRRG